MCNLQRQLAFVALAAVATDASVAPRALNPAALTTVPNQFVSALTPCFGKPTLSYLQCCNSKAYDYLIALASAIAPTQTAAMDADFKSVMSVAQQASSNCRLSSALSMCLMDNINRIVQLQGATLKLTAPAKEMLSDFQSFNKAIVSCGNNVSNQANCTKAAVNTTVSALSKVLLAYQ